MTMKKKLLSLCTAVAMTAMCAIPVQAAELKDVIQNYVGTNFGSAGQFDNLLNITLDVDTNMEHTTVSKNEYTNEDLRVAVPANNPSAKFNYKTTMSMASVRNTVTYFWLGAEAAIADQATDVQADLTNDLKNVKVTGGFTVDIIYPDSVTLPDTAVNGTNMDGFNANAKKIFKEKNRSVIPGYAGDVAEDGKNTFRIQIEVKDEAGTGDLRGEDLMNNIDTYLGDITLTCEDLTITGIDTHEIIGTVKGYTNIGGTYAEFSSWDANGGADQIAVVNYVAVQPDTADGYDVALGEIKETVTLVQASTPTPIPDDGGSSGGGSGGGGGFLPGAGGGPIAATPVPGATPTPQGTIVPGEPESSATLNRDDHYAYIIGYPEGDVRPENNITRAEVATIFFRIMGDESRDKYASSENVYTDVNAGDWYNNAISTVSNAGIVNGYEDGTFKPDAPIKRSEFATIAARFIGGKYQGDDRFSDIAGHWAAEYINRASKYGWINGYEDGTFKPDRDITRAEAMTLVNSVLTRGTEARNMHEDMVIWTDNTEDKWYYEEVQEATNAHNYTKENNVETWTEMRENRDWKALEIATFTPGAAVEEDAEEVTEEVTEETVTDETADETTEATDETVADETTEEVAEEVTEETVADETTEETVDETVTDEAVVEEEVPEEAAEEVVE